MPVSSYRGGQTINVGQCQPFLAATFRNLAARGFPSQTLTLCPFPPAVPQHGLGRFRLLRAPREIIFRFPAHACHHIPSGGFDSGLSLRCPRSAPHSAAFALRRSRAAQIGQDWPSVIAPWQVGQNVFILSIQAGLVA